MKKILFLIVLLLITNNVEAANKYRTRQNPWSGKLDYVIDTTSLEVGDLTATGTVSGVTTISTNSTIYGNLTIGGTIIGGGLSTTYLKLDASNDPLTGNLDLGQYNLNCGDVFCFDPAGTDYITMYHDGTDGIFGTNVGKVDIVPTTDVSIILPDASGARELNILDSGTTEVASIDSDGNIDCSNVTATGTVTGLVVSATNAFQVGSDYITDITGTGLTIVGGKLTSIAAGGESTTVSDTTTIDLTLTGADITADGLYTAGDNLTLTGADFDLDQSISLTNVTASNTVTGLIVSSTSALQVGSDYITDITGTGLSIVGGALTASSSGATAWDDIGDPDADTTIALGAYETYLTSTLDEASHYVLKIDNTDADLANETTLLGLEFTDNGDIDGVFIKANDNNGDLMWSLGYNGRMVIGASATDYALPTARGTQYQVLMDNGAGAVSFQTLSDTNVTDVLTINNASSVTTTGNVSSDNVIASATVTGVVVDTQYLEYSSGVALTVRDALIVNNALTITEGALANSTIVSADIKDGTIAEADLDIANAATDEYVLSYESDTSNFQWVAMSGGASKLWLLPESAVLDDTVPPAITVIESTGTGTPRRRVADFDAAADEILYWSFTWQGYTTATVYWYTNDLGANETCYWACQISATTEADADTMAEDAADTANSASEDCNATEVNRLILTPITLTNVDSAATGDYVTFVFYRDANNGSDDLSSDARLLGVLLE